MPRTPIGPGDRKQQQKREKSLQRRVLQHLKQHGPKYHDNLSLLFDPHRTGATTLAIEALTKRRYVKTDQDRMVQITKAGLRLLEVQDL